MLHGLLSLCRFWRSVTQESEKSKGEGDCESCERVCVILFLDGLLECLDFLGRLRGGGARGRGLGRIDQLKLVQRAVHAKKSLPMPGLEMDGSHDVEECLAQVQVECVRCGTSEPGAFSRRMINRRGRHGERSRRCRACVAADENASKPAHCEDCGQPKLRADMECTACLEIASLRKLRRKLLKWVGQIDELRRKRDSGGSLEETQLEKMGRLEQVRGELRLTEARLDSLQKPWESSVMQVAKRKREPECP